MAPDKPVQLVARRWPRQAYVSPMEAHPAPATRQPN